MSGALRCLACVLLRARHIRRDAVVILLQDLSITPLDRRISSSLCGSQ